MSISPPSLHSGNRAAQVLTAVRSMAAMVDGDLADFVAFVHPEAINREATAEPPAARAPGPEGFYATGQWLRSSFCELAFAIHDVVTEGDLVVVHATMSGRQTGDVVIYASDGTVERVFPPLGKSFAVTHSHWLRMRDGLVAEHWANRDDQGLAMQLGWVPPSPRYLLRCAASTRKARRSHSGGTGHSSS